MNYMIDVNFELEGFIMQMKGFPWFQEFKSLDELKITK